MSCGIPLHLLFSFRKRTTQDEATGIVICTPNRCSFLSSFMAPFRELYLTTTFGVFLLPKWIHFKCYIHRAIEFNLIYLPKTDKLIAFHFPLQRPLQSPMKTKRSVPFFISTKWHYFQRDTRDMDILFAPAKHISTSKLSPQWSIRCPDSVQEHPSKWEQISSG